MMHIMILEQTVSRISFLITTFLLSLLDFFKTKSIADHIPAGHPSPHVGWPTLELKVLRSSMKQIAEKIRCSFPVPLGVATVNLPSTQLSDGSKLLKLRCFSAEGISFKHLAPQAYLVFGIPSGACPICGQLHFSYQKSKLTPVFSRNPEFCQMCMCPFPQVKTCLGHTAQFLV